MNKLISVIVPVYKQNNDFLKQCLDSLINQTYPYLEIIVVNDGMTEENISLIKTFDDKRIRIVGTHNKGVSAARNLGIEESKGDYIVFVDSDDYLSEEFCQVTYRYAIEKNADIVTTSLAREYADHTEIYHCVEKVLEYDKKTFTDKLLNVQNCMGYMWGKLWKADYIKKGHIRLDENLVVAEDASFCISAIQECNKVIVIPDALYHYRLNTASVTKKYNKNYFENYRKAMKSTKRELIKMGIYDEYKVGFSNFVVYHLLMICVNYVYNNDNGLSYIKQTSLLKKILKSETFSDALKNSNYQDLSKSRKISLWILKHKLFIAMKIICTVRQSQFK